LAADSFRKRVGHQPRVVAYLGELRASQRNGWAELGRRLDRRQRPQPSLFDPPPPAESADDEAVLVRLKGIRLERLRDFGDAWLALGLWRLVVLDVFLEKLLPQGREDVPWPIATAAGWASDPTAATPQPDPWWTLAGDAKLWFDVLGSGKPLEIESLALYQDLIDPGPFTGVAATRFRPAVHDGLVRGVLDLKSRLRDLSLSWLCLHPNLVLLNVLGWGPDQRHLQFRLSVNETDQRLIRVLELQVVAEIDVLPAGTEGQ
jgi:hypothetical protein